MFFNFLNEIFSNVQQGTIIQFSWRWSVIASRVLALALFASEYSYYISIVCGLHWLIMFAWILTMKTSFCDNLLEETFYNAVLAVMFIFCYFNPVDSPTRWRFTFFYSFMLTENTLLLVFWYHKCDPLQWYRVPALAAYYVLFCCGIVLMVCCKRDLGLILIIYKIIHSKSTILNCIQLRAFKYLSSRILKVIVIMLNRHVNQINRKQIVIIVQL